MKSPDNVSAKRKNDAVITVCQDNIANTISISSINRAAEKLTGYRQLELADKSITTILPNNIRDIVNSYVDYTDELNDLAGVLRKVSDFHVLNRKGEEIPVSLKVFYQVTNDSNKLYFELLMRDISLINNLAILKNKVALPESYSKVGATLLSEEVLLSNMQLISDFCKTYPIEISVALVAIDDAANLASMNNTSVEELVEQLAVKAKKAFRTDDIIGIVEGKYICAILFDCSASDAQKALSRVKNKIQQLSIRTENRNSPILLNISTGYMQIIPGDTPHHIIDRCKSAIMKAQDAGGSRIYEVMS